MSAYEPVASPQAAELPSPRLGKPRGWRVPIMTWMTTCADYYEAACLYEEFRNLSDAELARRGLNRATLARDACAACDRSADSKSD